MPATMKKSDVQVSFKADQVKWSVVQQCAGARVPSAARQAVDESLANKKLKKLNVKIGLIKRDLFLRIKNGSDHIQDVKLVKDWTPPQDWIVDPNTVGDEEEIVEIDPDYQDRLQAWKDGREACKLLGEEVRGNVEQFWNETEQQVELAESEAGAVCSGRYDPDNASMTRANQALQRNADLRQQTDTEHDRYFERFDYYRTNEKGEEFRPEDTEGYGMEFYMKVLKPLYQQIVARQHAVAANVTKAEHAVAQINAFQQGGQNQAFYVKAQAIRQQVEDLLQKSRNVLGGMSGDIEFFLQGFDIHDEFLAKAQNQGDKLGNVDKGLQRLTAVRDAVPRMDGFMTELKLVLTEAGKIPKKLAKEDVQISQELDAFKQTCQEVMDYHKQWRKHAATAEDRYKQLLKQANK